MTTETTYHVEARHHDHGTVTFDVKADNYATAARGARVELNRRHPGTLAAWDTKVWDDETADRIAATPHFQTLANGRTVTGAVFDAHPDHGGRVVATMRRVRIENTAHHGWMVDGDPEVYETDFRAAAAVIGRLTGRAPASVTVRQFTA